MNLQEAKVKFKDLVESKGALELIERMANAAIAEIQKRSCDTAEAIIDVGRKVSWIFNGILDDEKDEEKFDEYTIEFDNIEDELEFSSDDEEDEWEDFVSEKYIEMIAIYLVKSLKAKALEEGKKIDAQLLLRQWPLSEEKIMNVVNLTPELRFYEQAEKKATIMLNAFKDAIEADA